MSRADSAPAASPAESNIARLRPSQPTAAPPVRRARALEIRLWLTDRRLADVWPADGLLLHRLPFVIGRLPDHTEHAPRSHVDLRLPDAAPYRLSRVHFCILNLDGAVAVMDTNSHFGTTVNGFTIGRGRPHNHAPLVTGTNRVAAGGRNSPWIFAILVR